MEKSYIISERARCGLSSHAFISISKFLTKIDFFLSGGEALILKKLKFTAVSHIQDFGDALPSPAEDAVFLEGNMRL